jgi:hypothetical protein
MTGIPVPESINDLAASIKQIINCTTKKATHLATKVKIFCVSFLTSVFDGHYLSYLLGRTLRPIQGKNPYRHAIEIAKIIDLSGSLVNLGGYDASCKGIVDLLVVGFGVVCRVVRRVWAAGTVSSNGNEAKRGILFCDPVVGRMDRTGT